MLFLHKIAIYWLRQSKHGCLFQQSAFGESFDSERSGINETLPPQDQIGGDASRRGGMHHAVAAEAVGEEQSLHARRGANDRVMIGADLVHPGPALLRVHWKVGELRNAVHGARQ